MSICNTRPPRNESERGPPKPPSEPPKPPGEPPKPHSGANPPKDLKGQKTQDPMTKPHKDLKSHKTPASEEEPHEDKKSHTLYIDTGTSILLQTAQADAYKPNEPETIVGVRVILDSGK